MRRMVLVAGLVSILAGGTPALAEVRASGIGAGLSAGMADSDALSEDLDFTGWTGYVKLAITNSWGFLLSYRDMEDDEDLLLEEDSYKQASVYLIRTWRVEKIVRPHFKIGASRVDFEREIGGLLTSDDDDLGFSVGGGLEVGSQRVALFGDYDFTMVDLFGEEFRISNATAGIMLKF